MNKQKPTASKLFRILRKSPHTTHREAIIHGFNLVFINSMLHQKMLTFVNLPPYDTRPFQAQATLATKTEENRRSLTDSRG